MLSGSEEAAGRYFARTGGRGRGCNERLKMPTVLLPTGETGKVAAVAQQESATVVSCARES